MQKKLLLTSVLLGLIMVCAHTSCLCDVECGLCTCWNSARQPVGFGRCIRGWGKCVEWCKGYKGTVREYGNRDGACIPASAACPS